MIDRVEELFDIKPDRLIGDTAYGTAPMLAWMVEEKDIEPHVPVWDKSERKGDSFSISDFHWNKAAEEYRCPAGKALRSEWRASTASSASTRTMWTNAIRPEAGPCSLDTVITAAIAPGIDPGRPSICPHFFRRRSQL